MKVRRTPTAIIMSPPAPPTISSAPSPPPIAPASLARLGIPTPPTTPTSPATIAVADTAARHAPHPGQVPFRLKIGIYLLFFSVYLLSSAGHFFATDEIAVYLTTQSLVERHSLAIKPIQDATTKLLTPPSAIVGTSGRIAAR